MNNSIVYHNSSVPKPSSNKLYAYNNELYFSNSSNT